MINFENIFQTNNKYFTEKKSDSSMGTISDSGFKDVLSEINDTKKELGLSTQVQDDPFSFVSISDDNQIKDNNFNDVIEQIKKKKTPAVKASEPVKYFQLEKSVKKDLEKLNVSFSFINLKDPEAAQERMNFIANALTENKIETDQKVQNLDSNPEVIINDDAKLEKYSKSTNSLLNNVDALELPVPLSSSILLVSNKLNTKITSFIENSSKSFNIDIYAKTKDKNLNVETNTEVPAENFAEPLYSKESFLSNVNTGKINKAVVNNPSGKAVKNELSKLISKDPSVSKEIKAETKIDLVNITKSLGKSLLDISYKTKKKDSLDNKEYVSQIKNNISEAKVKGILLEDNIGLSDNPKLSNDLGNKGILEEHNFDNIEQSPIYQTDLSEVDENFVPMVNSSKNNNNEVLFNNSAKIIEKVNIQEIKNNAELPAYNNEYTDISDSSETPLDNKNINDNYGLTNINLNDNTDKLETSGFDNIQQIPLHKNNLSEIRNETFISKVNNLDDVKSKNDLNYINVSSQDKPVENNTVVGSYQNEPVKNIEENNIQQIKSNTEFVSNPKTQINTEVTDKNILENIGSSDNKLDTTVSGNSENVLEVPTFDNTQQIPLHKNNLSEIKNEAFISKSDNKNDIRPENESYKAIENDPDNTDDFSIQDKPVKKEEKDHDKEIRNDKNTNESNSIDSTKIVKESKNTIINTDKTVNKSDKNENIIKDLSFDLYDLSSLISSKLVNQLSYAVTNSAIKNLSYLDKSKDNKDVKDSVKNIKTEIRRLLQERLGKTSAALKAEKNKSDNLKANNNLVSYAKELSLSKVNYSKSSSFVTYDLDKVKEENKNEVNQSLNNKIIDSKKSTLRAKANANDFEHLNNSSSEISTSSNKSEEFKNYNSESKVNELNSSHSDTSSSDSSVIENRVNEPARNEGLRAERALDNSVLNEVPELRENGKVSEQSDVRGFEKGLNRLNAQNTTTEIPLSNNYVNDNEYISANQNNYSAPVERIDANVVQENVNLGLPLESGKVSVPSNVRTTSNFNSLNNATPERNVSLKNNQEQIRFNQSTDAKVINNGSVAKNSSINSDVTVNTNEVRSISSEVKSANSDSVYVNNESVENTGNGKLSNSEVRNNSYDQIKSSNNNTYSKQVVSDSLNNQAEQVSDSSVKPGIHESSVIDSGVVLDIDNVAVKNPVVGLNESNVRVSNVLEPLAKGQVNTEDSKSNVNELNSSHLDTSRSDSSVIENRANEPARNVEGVRAERALDNSVLNEVPELRKNGKVSKQSDVRGFEKGLNRLNAQNTTTEIPQSNNYVNDNEYISANQNNYSAPVEKRNNNDLNLEKPSNDVNSVVNVSSLNNLENYLPSNIRPVEETSYKANRNTFVSINDDNDTLPAIDDNENDISIAQEGNNLSSPIEADNDLPTNEGVKKISIAPEKNVSFENKLNTSKSVYSLVGKTNEKVLGKITYSVNEKDYVGGSKENTSSLDKNSISNFNYNLNKVSDNENKKSNREILLPNIIAPIELDNLNANVNLENIKNNRKMYSIFKETVTSEFPEIEIIENKFENDYFPHELSFVKNSVLETKNEKLEKFMNIISIDEPEKVSSIKTDNDTSSTSDDDNDTNNSSRNQQVSSTMIIQAINDGVPIHFSKIPGVVKELISDVSTKTTQTISLNITLSPANLGDVTLTCSLSEGNKMSVEFETSTMAGQKTIESYFQSIKSIISENSLVVNEVSSNYQPTTKSNVKDKVSSNSSSEKSESDSPNQLRRKKKRGNTSDPDEEIKVNI